MYTIIHTLIVNVNSIPFFLAGSVVDPVSTVVGHAVQIIAKDPALVSANAVLGLETTVDVQDLVLGDHTAEVVEVILKSALKNLIAIKMNEERTKQDPVVAVLSQNHRHMDVLHTRNILHTKSEKKQCVD